MRKAKSKLKDSRGFSLAETLLAVLILLLVSVVVATGMPAVTNAYNKVVLGANAKTMLSTAVIVTIISYILFTSAMAVIDPCRTQETPPPANCNHLKLSKTIPKLRETAGLPEFRNEGNRGTTLRPPALSSRHRSVRRSRHSTFLYQRL